VTTGFRFHPVEIVLSMLWKFAVIAAIGAGPLAVVIFEVILSALAMFNHANLRLPGAVDRVVRLFVVTPDMHRVHHSVVRAETDSNYGFNLSVWDRMFGTYRPQPEAGHTDMQIGLADYRSFAPARLGWSLLLPFRGRAEDR
jgi:sterol desaturase/sphingolipid hydroxylase (fatty acid hydroxylase superfamily)